MVKEYDREPSGDLWICLDMDAAVQVGEGEESTEEYGVILAASSAAEWLRANRAVGLVAFGAQATLRRNVVTGSVNKGVLVRDRSDATVVGNALAGNRDGASVTLSATATIEANTVQNDADNGIAVKASVVEIGGNDVRANRGVGIWLRDAGARATVTATTVDRNGNHGIGVGSGVTAVIDGNVVPTTTAPASG